MNVKNNVLLLADEYKIKLKNRIDSRIIEIESDNNDHYLIYKVLGIAFNEGKLIDEYQNKGRFLYKYAGSFLEEATLICFESKFSNLQKKYRIKNQVGIKPKTFKIDCLINNQCL